MADDLVRGQQEKNAEAMRIQLKYMAKQVDTMDILTKRLKLFHEAQDGAAEFLLANLPEAIEGGAGPGLMKFRCNTWMPISEAHFAAGLKEDGSYETESYEASLVHTPRRCVAIDAGANIGLWARRMAADFGVVHCFEPQAQARACLARNAAFNNVVLYPYALGSEPGEAIITVNRLGIGGGMIPVTEKYRAASHLKYPTTEEKVTVIPIDDFNLQPDYIKIDVQGFEVDLLRGGERTIRKYRPTIVCEIEGDATIIDTKAALPILREFGYRLAETVGKNGVFVPL
jgi:FkbM family methyltransferase